MIVYIEKFQKIYKKTAGTNSKVTQNKVNIKYQLIS